MLNVSRRQKGVTLGRWLLRDYACKDVLLTSTTHARVGNTTGVRPERKRRYDSTERFACGKQDHNQWGCPQRRYGIAGKGVHGHSRSHTRRAAASVHPRLAQHTGSKTTAMTPASATPRSLGI